MLQVVKTQLVYKVGRASTGGELWCSTPVGLYLELGLVVGGLHAPQMHCEHGTAVHCR